MYNVGKRVAVRMESFVKVIRGAGYRVSLVSYHRSHNRLVVRVRAGCGCVCAGSRRCVYQLIVI